MTTTSRTTMFVLLMATLAMAIPADAAAEELSLQKARELALSRSASLRKYELAVEAASLDVKAQGYATLPSVSASAGASLGYGSSTASLADALGATVKVSASETVYDGGKNAALSRKYGIAAEAARQALRSARVSMVGTADTAFFAVLEAKASVEAAQSDLDAANMRLKIAKAKVDAGALSKSDYLQTEAQTASYETTLIKAKKSLSSARAKLASLTGLPASTEPKAVEFSAYDSLIARLDALDEAGTDRLVASVKELARANNPDLSGYSLSTEKARAAVEVAKAAYLPTVSASASPGLSYSGSSGDISASVSLSLTASLSLDLWNTKVSVASAELAASQAELDSSGGQSSVELSVEQAVYEWLASARALRASAKALEYAESSYTNVFEKFKLSSATVSDISTAEALVSADKTALITARYGFLSDLSTIRGLAGLEDEAKILEALK